MNSQIVQTSFGAFAVREAAFAEILSLRHRVLRAGLPVEEAHFSGDAAAGTRHGGAFDGQNVARCCATLHLEAWEGEPAWRLRGMATDEGFRSLGLGRAVLEYVTALAIEDAASPRLFFCNARTPAVAFYEREGWRTVSEEFDIPTAGPHRKMVRRV